VGVRNYNFALISFKIRIFGVIFLFLENYWHYLGKLESSFLCLLVLCLSQLLGLDPAMS